MELWKKLKRVGLVRSTVALMCLFILFSSLLFILHLDLPDLSLDNTISASFVTSANTKSSNEMGLGKLGEMMVEMLPDDLAFTIFVPSDNAFGRVLKLRANECLVEQKMNDTIAIISRVMGFSAVPRHLPSQAVPLREEVSVDSISGFRLYAWRAANGTLIVNNIMSELVDMRKSEIIVHKIKGVLMDAEFELSFFPMDDEG